ncbi:unnamed protein product, partial [Ectocarpus sp. 12 AP-2014]
KEATRAGAVAWCYFLSHHYTGYTSDADMGGKPSAAAGAVDAATPPGMQEPIQGASELQTRDGTSKHNDSSSGGGGDLPPPASPRESAEPRGAGGVEALDTASPAPAQAKDPASSDGTPSHGGGGDSRTTGVAAAAAAATVRVI